MSRHGSVCTVRRVAYHPIGWGELHVIIGNDIVFLDVLLENTTLYETFRQIIPLVHMIYIHSHPTLARWIRWSFDFMVRNTSSGAKESDGIQY